jgi:hypothetical protein
MDLNKTMNRMRKMMPGRKQGMSTGSKIMLMAVPVVLFAVGKMISSRMHDDSF